MSLPSHSIRTWQRQARAAGAAALALLLCACGGGGEDPKGPAKPEILAAPADVQAIVGQQSSFFVEGQGAGLTFAWQEQPGGSGDWRAASGVTAGDGFVSSTLTVGPVDIGMDKTRFRGIVGNNAGSVASGEARLDVVWGTVATRESDSLDFGPGPSGPGGSADGGTPGGGDGEGAGVGGGLGKTPRAIISLTRAADGAPLGSAPAGASGLVQVIAGPGAAPVTITLRGAPDAIYYDEGRDAMLPLPADQELHAFALNFDRHLGVTTLTEAAYRYALNNFLQDPAAVRAGTVPIKRTATPEEIARLTTAQIQLANEAIRNEINRILPARYALDSISTLPALVDNTSPSGATTDNIFGRMQAVVGGLSLAAARFEPSLANPALRMTAQLVDDLTDGVVDGQALDQRSVFDAPGTNAYSPATLPQLLADAADAQVERFGDGTIPVPPPVINGQPSAAVITRGGTATLSVSATGSQLAFQWFRDRTAIPDATRPELATQLGGEYHVNVTNTAGTVSSARVTVTVVDEPALPQITAQPVSATVTSGSSAVFTVQAAGTNLRYQWQLVSAPNTANDIAGAVSSSWSTSIAGTYRVVVWNDLRSVTSDDVTLTVTPVVIEPRITSQPTSQVVIGGRAVTLQVEATGSPLAFQWHNENGPITNAVASSWTTSTAGTYHVVVSNGPGSTSSVESNHVTVSVITPPAITTQPASVSINPGQTATLSVVASGTSPSYQWQRDGINVEGTNAASYSTVTAGSYTVVVSNDAGRVTSTAAIVTIVSAPVIVTQPVSAEINEGQDHTFTVVATGSDLRYQWFADGGSPTPMPGAAAASWTTRTAGYYFVEVSNSVTRVRSTTVRLGVTVIVPPTASVQPASVTIARGRSATLTASATGTAPFTYQWSGANGPIANATSAAFTTELAGTYTVTITNAAGRSSASATVNVIDAPVITTHPASVTINQGQTTTLSVVATGTALQYQWRINGSNIGDSNVSSLVTGVAGIYTVVVRNAVGEVTSNPATVTVVVGAPTITQQPTYVCCPERYVVVATGGTLRYQWYTVVSIDGEKFDVPIPGATTNSLPWYLAVPPFYVVVSNDVGATTSEVVKPW